MMHLPIRVAAAFVLTICVLATPATAQQQSTDYVIGAQDVLAITSYDQADLSGRFTVEADGTFTYPLIGRVKAGGLTLRGVEAELKKRLKDEGYFKNPEITVSVDQFKSQKIFIVGEVRNPGPYLLSGEISMIEALARAGSTLPSAGSEALIIHQAAGKSGLAAAAVAHLDVNQDGENVVRVNLRDLESGKLSQNATLRDGDTIVVPRALSVYVFGEVKNPGAYALQQKGTTVLQALSLAGGLTERATDSRIRIVRIVNGDKKEIRVKLTDVVQPGDTIIVPERYF